MKTMCLRCLFPKEWWRVIRTKHLLRLNIRKWTAESHLFHAVRAEVLPQCLQWSLSPVSPRLSWPSPGCGSSLASGPAACSSPLWRSCGCHSKWARCKSGSLLLAPHSTKMKQDHVNVRMRGIIPGFMIVSTLDCKIFYVPQFKAHDPFYNMSYIWFTSDKNLFFFFYLAVVLQWSVDFCVAGLAKHWTTSPVKSHSNHITINAT